MTERMRLRLLAFACTTAGVFAASSALACSGAGIITRIDGRPQDVAITRTVGGKSAAVAKPRVLEVVCPGDVIRVSGGGRLHLSVDGAGKVQVASGSAFTVPARKGAPSVAGNAYRQVNENVVPDMKRLPWNVRLKGAGTGFEFALPALASGQQTLRAGRRDLLVRLAGGSGPYRVELMNEAGQAVASTTSPGEDAVLRGVNLTAGAYRLKASDSAGNVIEARLPAGDRAPPVDAAYAGLPDAEIRAAVTALELAKANPGTWALEAEQLLAAAPEEGLDRARVYELLESYDVDAPAGT